MKDKINGRTPEEIKKGLDCCFPCEDPECLDCPYRGTERCADTRIDDTLAYIQQLERERDQYKRERDAAVADIKQIIQDPFGVSCCDFCKFGDNEEECEKRNCRGNRADFEWRGLEVE